MIDYSRVLRARELLLSRGPSRPGEDPARGLGLGPCSARLLLLSHLPLAEPEARRAWDAIAEHRGRLVAALDRDVGLTTAIADYFLNVQQRMVSPTFIELDDLEAEWRSAVADPLTGLLSDSAFREEVAIEVARARRYGRPVAVVMCELDDSAPLAAVHGAQGLDLAICEAAELLRKSCRAFDRVARPEGDGLAALLPGASGSAATRAAERFRSHVERRFADRTAQGAPLALTVSAGVASFPQDASSPAKLCERAAAALHAAKVAGRNRVVRSADPTASGPAESTGGKAP